MIEMIFPWVRYWYPRGTTIPLTEDGFLYVPHALAIPGDRSEHGSRFEDLVTLPCIVLLGQPGIGKSQAVKDAVASAKALFPSDKIEFLDLAEYGEIDLDRDITRILQEWADGAFDLHLFLDSLDSARLRIETLTHMVLRALRRHATALGRLRLRIVCREAEWPHDFEKGLVDLWRGEPAGRLGAFVLAPLQRVDAQLAAQMSGLESEPFMQAISRGQLGPLAASPVTLNLLIHSYQPDGRLARTRYELYLNGCMALCNELDDAHTRRSRLEPEQRFLVAARVAACTVFTNRHTIDDETKLDSESADLVTATQLAGGAEAYEEAWPHVPNFTVSKAGIQEAVATALFRGAGWRTWAHRTYAEFLAGWYAATHLTPRQIRSLLFHADGHPTPQLRETALWIAGASAEVFEDLIRVEPQLLLRSDIMTSDSATKTRVVDALLRQLELGDAIHYELIRWYANLTHPGLARQVRPCIEDKTKPHDARLAALLLAVDCEARDLQDLLADVALDDTEAADLRVIAARGVAEFGDSSTKQRLKSLALLPLADLTSRDKDQLKQYGIEACWPVHVGASELFATLAPIQGEEFVFHGAYLAHAITPYLAPDDLLIALDWVAKQPTRRSLPYSMRQLMDSIMLRAWEMLEERIASSFARAVVSRAVNHDPVVATESVLDVRPSVEFLTSIREDSRRRRLLIASMVRWLAGMRDIADLVGKPQAPLVFSQDVEWLIGGFASARFAWEQAVYAQLILTAWDKDERSQQELVYSACERSPQLNEALGRPFDPVPLNSPLVHRLREIEAMRQKPSQETAEARPVQPPEPSPRRRVLQCLQACETEKAEDWWLVCYWMVFRPDGTSDYDAEDSNLQDRPVWSELTEAERARVLTAATKYVEVCDPGTYEWFGAATEYRAVVAGYVAFRALLDLAPALLTGVSDVAWKNWAQAILYYSHRWRHPGTSRLDNNPNATLARLAYEKAPQCVIAGFVQVIDFEDKRGYLSITDWLEMLWDQRLAEAVCSIIEHRGLQPQVAGPLVESLLRKEFEAGEALAEALMASRSDGPDARQLAVHATRALLLYVPGQAWEVIWAAFQEDADFGRDVIREVASHRGQIGRTIVGKLSPQQAADLFIWLSGQFPLADDPPREGIYEVTIKHEVADFRDSVVQAIRDMGTQATVAELQRIIRTLPELDLRWELAQAQDLARRTSWVWAEPAHLRRLASAREPGLVQNCEQLLDLILESLERLQVELQDTKAPAAPDLWNVVRRHRTVSYTPKDEEHLSAYVARHLQELAARHIIVNREVRIHYESGRTDIYVEAFVNKAGEPGDLLTAIIETKGCWHPKLEQAMETQLVNKYLRDSCCGSTCGLYLVGFYGCPKWDSTDRRKAACAAYSLDGLRIQMDAQAAAFRARGLLLRSFLLNVALPGRTEEPNERR